MSDAADERERVERAIVAQEGLRETIGDEAVDVTLSVLRERLAAITGTDQRRRQATVLFADVTGFTSLAGTLDAEIVTEIINEVWRRLDAVLRQHGALIDALDAALSAGDLEDALGLLRRVLFSDTLTWDYRRDAERVVARIRRAADPQAVDHGLRPWDGEACDLRELVRELRDRLSSGPQWDEPPRAPTGPKPA